MIIFKRSGQLANQIFQVAYALSIQSSEDEIVLLNDIDEFISCFDLPTGLRNVRRSQGAARIADPFFLARLASSVRAISTIVEVHSSYGDTVTVIHKKGLIPIKFVKGGWFQDYNLVKQIDQSFPSIRGDVCGYAQRWFEEAGCCGRKLFFCHIRRSDYLNFHATGINVALPLRYYLKGLDLLLAGNPDAKLLIASDDLEFVELAFADSAWDYTLIREDAKTTFAIMSLCDAGVISNSSFSWWAGLMVVRCGGRIIGPKNWFGWRGDRCVPPTIATPDFEWLPAR